MNEVVGDGAKQAGISVSELCDRVEMSRQNYYAARRLRQRREVDEALILRELQSRLAPVLALRATDAMLAPESIDALVAPFLGGYDPVFGFLSGLTLPQFFDGEKITQLRARVALIAEGVVLIVGALEYFPALALGPIVEHFQMLGGKLF